MKFALAYSAAQVPPTVVPAATVVIFTDISSQQKFPFTLPIASQGEEVTLPPGTYSATVHTQDAAGVVIGTPVDAVDASGNKQFTVVAPITIQIPSGMIVTL